MKKIVKQANLQQITDINSYQKRALLWNKYEHGYSKVYKVVDWGKMESFMCTSHVTVSSAKTIT